MRPFYENKDGMSQCFEAPDLEFPEHLHDHVELLLVLAGSVVVRIMDKCRELQAGDCAVIFPQQVHSYHTPSGSRTRLFIFDSSLSGMFLHSIRKCVPACPFLSARELSGDGELALDRIRRCLSDPGAAEAPRAGTEELCSAWIQVLFALAWPRLMPEKRDQSEGTELTCQVVQYVMEHFQEPLTLDTLARALHVNKYYISRIFSSQLQINFRRYLHHIRLEYAMQLMKTGSAPLIDICSEAGFNSLRSFNRAFMDIMGMSPREYRKSAAGSIYSQHS